MQYSIKPSKSATSSKNEKYKKAERKFGMSQLALERDWYEDSIFNLHQACENLFYATRLTFTLQNNKQHNLSKLLNSVKKYSEDFIKIFPRKTVEEKRLFEMVKAAYVGARYNPDFPVTKEDIDILMPTIEQLFKLVKRICEERIREYGKMK